MRGFPIGVDGYAGSLACAREVSAVIAACMRMRKSFLHEIARFNEHFSTASARNILRHQAQLENQPNGNWLGRGLPYEKFPFRKVVSQRTIAFRPKS